MKTFMMTALAAAMASSVAVAEVSVPNTFFSGEEARAAEVNQNFSALVQAINSNSDRISEIENKINETISVADVLAGSTFKMMFTESGIEYYYFDEDGGGERHHVSSIFEGAGDVVFTLNDGGSDAVVNGVLGDVTQEVNYKERKLNNIYVNGEEIPPEDSSETQPPVTGGSWSYDEGSQELTVVWPGDGQDPAKFVVALDGNVLVFSDLQIRERDRGSDFDSVLGVAVRIDDGK